MSSSQAILAEIRASAAELGITPATLCQQALRSSKMPKRLEAGRSITVDSLERLRAYVADRKRAVRIRLPEAVD